MARNLRRIVMRLSLAVAVWTAPLVLAADQASGTVVAITEGVAEVRAANGTTYKIEGEDIVVEDLTTGDVVAYAAVEGQPVRVKKKAK